MDRQAEVIAKREKILTVAICADIAKLRVARVKIPGNKNENALLGRL